MRQTVPTALLLAVLAGSSIAAAAPSPSETPAEPPAAARTTVQVADAAVTRTGGATDRAGLGRVQLVSERDGTPWAGMDLLGGEVAGEQVADWSASSDDEDGRSGDARIALPSTAGATADLSLLDYQVRAAGREAAATVSTLMGRLALGPLDLRVRETGPALSTSVGDRSSAITTLALGAVELTLGDLLPPNLVDQLPLGVTIDLLQRLPVAVPTAEQLITRIQELLDDLTALVDAVTALDEARASLRELVSEAPGVAAAEDAVAAAEAALAEATERLQDALADREAARDVLADAEATLAEVLEQTPVDDVTETVDDTVDDVTETVDDTVDDVTDTVTEPVEDATDTVDDVVDDVTEPVDDVTEPVDDATDPVDDVTDPVTDPVEDVTDPVTDPVDDLTGSGTDPVEDVTEGVGGGLGGLGGDLGGRYVLAAAVQDLDLGAAEDAVAEAEDAVAAANGVVRAARGAVDTAEAALADATASLDELVDEAAGALAETTGHREQIVRLRDDVEQLLSRVLERVVALPELPDLLAELRGSLADVPVLALDGVSLDVALDADAERGRADVTCTIGSVAVFGEPVPAPRCSEASDLLATLPDHVAALLGELPLEELPVPRISGLSVATDASPQPVDGVTWATAHITGLAVEIPSVALTSVSDELTATLDGLLGQALTAARALPDTVLGGAAAPAVDTVLSTIGDLRAQLDVLPGGGQLAGQRTLGIDLTMGRIASEVLHGATADGPLELAPPFELTATVPVGVPVGAPDDGPWRLEPCYGLALVSLGLLGGLWRQRRRMIT